MNRIQCFFTIIQFTFIPSAVQAYVFQVKQFRDQIKPQTTVTIILYTLDLSNYCILDTSNLVLMISSSESSSGSELVGMFSSTQRRSESRLLLVSAASRASPASLVLLPRIFTPYASFTNCSSSSVNYLIERLGKINEYTMKYYTKSNDSCNVNGCKRIKKHV